MSAPQHTPGPYRRVDRQDYAEIVGPDGTVSQPIAMVARREDADLFAAAPDLLAACEQFIPGGIAIGNGYVPDDLVIPLDVTMGELRKLEAAIAKARGQ